MFPTTRMYIRLYVLTLDMSRCPTCGEDRELYECPNCGADYCADHRVPNSHNCPLAETKTQTHEGPNMGYWERSAYPEPAFALTWWFYRVPRFLIAGLFGIGVFFAAAFVANGDFYFAGATLLLTVCPYLLARKETPGQHPIPGAGILSRIVR